MPDDVVTAAPPSVTDPTRPLLGKLARGISLSRVQSIVAILAGTATVLGAAISLSPISRPARTGTLIAVVQSAGPKQTVADATVEILTPDDALVASLTPDAAGRVMHACREGVYLVRVSKPHYGTDVHRIEVQAGETVEVKATLHPGSSASVDRSLNKGVTAIRRALGLR